MPEVATDFLTDSAEGTRAVGAALGQVARPLPAAGLVVALEGELGAGKTVFVQGLARGLGVPARVRIVSPTFTVARDYEAQGPDRVALHHVDAYRLAGPADLEAAGGEEMCGPGRVTCVEWASRVAGALPPDRLVVRIDACGTSQRRRIAVRSTGPASAAVLARLMAARPEGALA